MKEINIAILRKTYQQLKTHMAEHHNYIFLDKITFMLLEIMKKLTTYNTFTRKNEY